MFIWAAMSEVTVTTTSVPLVEATNFWIVSISEVVHSFVSFTQRKPAPRTAFFSAVQPSENNLCPQMTLYLLIFGVSVGQFIPVASGTPYLLFLVPGLIMMGVLNNAFQNSSGSIMVSKFHGDLEDLRTTPLTTQQVVWAMSVASMVRGLIVGLVITLTGQIFFRLQSGVWFTIVDPYLSLFFLVVGGLTFAQIGIFVAFFSTTFDQLNAFGAFILLPLIYLGGVFFSLENLHPLWREVSVFNPLLYFINGLRYGVLGTSDLAIARCVGMSFACVAVSSLLATWSVKRGHYHRF